MNDEEGDPLRSECAAAGGAGVSLRWAAEVSSSVYSAPLIADLFGDGTKEIVVPTFVHYLESLQAREPCHGLACAACGAFAALGFSSRHERTLSALRVARVQGADGAKTEGFPGFHASMVHTSPFLFDADADGTLDIGRVLAPCCLLSRALTRAWRAAARRCLRAGWPRTTARSFFTRPVARCCRRSWSSPSSPCTRRVRCIAAYSAYTARARYV